MSRSQVGPSTVVLILEQGFCRVISEIKTKSIRFLEVPILYVNIKGFMIYDEQSCYDNKGTVHDIQVPNNIWLLAKPPAKKHRGC